MKKLFTLFTFALFAIVSLKLSALSVSAEEPKTYYLKYEASINDWWYVDGNQWDAGTKGNNIYFFNEGVKDGDHVIVAGTSGEQELHINAKLGSLTIMANSASSVYATAIENCYILSGGYANIHSDVTNGYLYDFSICNFNKDARHVTVSYTDLPTISVAIVGKCDELLVQDASTGFRKFHYYDFKAPVFMGDSKVENDPSQYSLTPTAANAAPSAPSADDEYDEVPKTGEANNYLFVLTAAMFCFAGAYVLKRRF